MTANGGVVIDAQETAAMTRIVEAVDARVDARVYREVQRLSLDDSRSLRVVNAVMIM